MNLKELFGHLTNFTLNKDNQNYINKTDFMNEDSGTKRLVSNVFKYMEKELDCDIEELIKNIKDVVIKVAILVINIYRVSQ